MVFKQSVLKEQKGWVRLSCFVCALGFLMILIVCLSLMNGRIQDTVLLLMYVLIFLASMPLRYFLVDCEWFEVYQDRIVARCMLRIKNIVYFENVKWVEEGKINLLRGGVLVDFYILNDGRRNKRPGWWNPIDFRNSKKYNLRIYKTPELEVFLRERFEIKQKNFISDE